MQAEGVLRSPSAEGVEAGADRPYTDCHGVAPAGADPVHKLAGKEVGYGVYN